MTGVRRGTVLLVDDEANARTVYGGLLASWGYEVLAAGGSLEAMELALAAPDLDTALIDVRMPPPDGMALFHWLRERFQDLPVIILTAYGTIDSAVGAISEGAFHYLAKPPEPEQLRSILEKAVTQVGLRREVQRLRERLGEEGDDPVGRSPAFARVLEMARAVAGSDAPVLLLGETGTGKERVARLIHAAGRRRAGPFVGLNCGALPPTLLESELFGHEKGAFTGALAARAGRVETADGGTLFLDEVGDCTPELQVKLLRVLEEKEFCRVGSSRPQRSDFRLVAATNRDLAAAVRENRFREDLFFRLNVVEIELPPLRERMEDLPALALHLLGRQAAAEKRQVTGISPAAMTTLLAHHWPGNIRELANVLHRAVVLADGPVIGPDHLPAALGQREKDGSRGVSLLRGFEAGHTLADWERMVMLSALHRCKGNKSRAAAVLGISRKVLYAKLARHGIPS